MRRVIAGLLGIIGLALVGCLHAPVLWSPDGHWVAYTLATRPSHSKLEPGWLFDASPRDDRAGAATVPARIAPLVYRLWATRVESSESVLLEESKGPMTSPCWSPDGQALAFGRLVPEEEGRARFEIVVQEAPDRKRVVLSRPINEFNARAEELPGLAPAWSPDARYLAVPLFSQELALGVIRADNGRILKIIEDAYLPSWSPDGTRLAFVQGGEHESLRYIDQNFGPPRHLADIGQSCQAPVWTRDGRSLVIVARRTAIHRREPASQQVDLLKVHVEGGKLELITTLYNEPGDQGRAYRGTSFVLDREGHTLFHVTDVENNPTVITQYHLRSGETIDRFHPIDHTIGLGALAISPNGKTLAFRVGSPCELSTPAFFDLATKQVTPLVPDESARIEWVTTLIQSARGLLLAQLPTVDAQGRAIARPTLLPVPGEIPGPNEISLRLRRIGRIGRSLCDRPGARPRTGQETPDPLAEARLFFDFLCEDYSSALASLKALESSPTTSEQRLRLLGVRAQIFMGLSKPDQAIETIEFLQTIEGRAGHRLEETPLGLELAGDPGMAERWSAYLSERTLALVEVSHAKRTEVPLGHRNPDNPNPNADFVPDPAGAPIPFAPAIREVPRMLPLFPEFEAPVGVDPNQRVFTPPNPPLLPRAGRPEGAP